MPMRGVARLVPSATLLVPVLQEVGVSDIADGCDLFAVLEDIEFLVLSCRWLDSHAQSLGLDLGFRNVCLGHVFFAKKQLFFRDDEFIQVLSKWGVRVWETDRSSEKHAVR